MATHTIRAAVARAVVVVGLAAALAVGGLGTVGPRGAAAAPRYTCEQAAQLANMYWGMAHMAYLAGDYVMSGYYAGKASAYNSYC
jgi:hypothetical protein